jgi:hypothetical protein
MTRRHRCPRSSPCPSPTGPQCAMGCWTTGVAVITTVDRNGRPHGMTVNSLTSVSPGPAAADRLPHPQRPHRRRGSGRGPFRRVHPRRPARAHRPPCPAHSPTSTAPSTGTSTPATTSSCSAPCSTPVTAMGNPWRSSAAASATTPTAVTNPSTGSSKLTLGWRAAHRWSRRELTGTPGHNTRRGMTACPIAVILGTRFGPQNDSRGASRSAVV